MTEFEPAGIKGPGFVYLMTDGKRLHKIGLIIGAGAG